MGENATHPGMAEYIEKAAAGTTTRLNAAVAHASRGFQANPASTTTFGVESMDSEMVWLKATPKIDASGAVVLWERNVAHPGPSHEIFIGANSPPVLCARTKAVDGHLGLGNLMFSSEEDLKQYHIEAVRRQRQALRDEMKRTGDQYRMEAEQMFEEEEGLSLQQLAAQVEEMQHTAASAPVHDEIKRGPGRPKAADRE